MYLFNKGVYVWNIAMVAGNGVWNTTLFMFDTVNKLSQDNKTNKKRSLNKNGLSLESSWTDLRIEVFFVSISIILHKPKNKLNHQIAHLWSYFDVILYILIVSVYFAV